VPIVCVRLETRRGTVDYSPSRKSVFQNEAYFHCGVRRNIPILYVARQVITRTMASDVMRQVLEAMTTSRKGG